MKKLLLLCVFALTSTAANAEVTWSLDRGYKVDKDGKKVDWYTLTCKDGTVFTSDDGGDLFKFGDSYCENHGSIANPNGDPRAEIGRAINILTPATIAPRKPKVPPRTSDQSPTP